MLRHVDVTSKRREADESKELVQLTEASLALLDLIFPRHIIEYMTRDAATAGDGSAPPAATAPALDPGQGQPCTVPSAASLCLNTLSAPGNDFRHLTTQHEQVRPWV